MEIKLCPFCNSIPQVDDQDDERDGGFVPDDCVPVKCFSIGCGKCDFQITKDTQDAAVSAWNTRHTERESVINMDWEPHFFAEIKDGNLVQYSNAIAFEINRIEDNARRG